MERKEFAAELECKAGEEDGTIQGYASTFGGKPDSYNDIIAQGAFIESIEKNGYGGNGIKMLWQHNSSMPAGIWTNMFENKTGLKIKGQLAIKTTIGNDAYELMKLGAINSLSIGFNIVDSDVNPKNGIRTIKKADLWEVSLVTFPANTNATITQVKALIEESKTERELEQSLNSFGLSREASKYIVNLCDFKKLGFGMNLENENTNKILNCLRDVNSKMKTK